MSDPLSMTAAQVEALSEDQAAEVLAAWVKAKQTSLAEALVQSKSKPHAKLAKKALYQLKSVGAAVAEVKPVVGETVAPLPSREDEAMLGTMSPVLGTGDRALFFARPLRGGGVEIYQAIISDEFGIAQFDRAQTNRAVYRTRIKELRAQADISLVFVPLERIIEELGRAMTLNDRSRTNIPAEMADGLTRLGVVPLDPDWKLPPLEPGDEAKDGATLHDEPEIKQWMPPEAQLAAMSAIAAEVKDDPAKQAAKGAELATAFFTPGMRQIYGRRLWQMAELFDGTGRADAATLARATGRQLFYGSGSSSFCTRLFVKAFDLALKPNPAEKLKEALATAPAAPKLSAPR
ncbi:MAG: hypothetical protein JNJ54_28905 [Myxococcaceae bacterium]|nr:hypothetical protein [Myxococcaceae bacterium]